MLPVSTHPLGPLLQPARRLIRRTLLILPPGPREFVLFGLKMAWSCLFGAAMLVLMIATHLWWPHDLPLHRYDFLFGAALAIQALMLWTRLESFGEMKVILLYHLIGTVMEVFKTHMGSWIYPEASIFHIGGVPLFTGFMYGSVGSFIARAIRVFDMRFSNYPKPWATWLLSAAIYANFYADSFGYDFRLYIFTAAILLFRRCFVFFRPDERVLSMPLWLAATLTSAFLWLAENVGTFTHTWSYPGKAWHLVPLAKMGAWGLLLIISFVTVTLVFPPKVPEPEETAPRRHGDWWRNLTYRFSTSFDRASR
jgi:uncharacterized membrane protein YoaT (DUF817 family)